MNIRSRRTRTAAIAFIMLALFAGSGWAGGVGENGEEPAGDVTVLEVGTMPILPVAQYFIIRELGWDRDAGYLFRENMFQSGPAMVQAVASGELDLMFFGIGPAMVSRSRGQEIEVIASLIVEQMSFIADGELAAYWDENDPAGTFSRFREAAGRRAKIATFQEGSVPHVVLLYWLEKVLGAGTVDVEIIGMGANAVQQSLLSGAVDAASTLEPIVSIVIDRNPEFRILARGGTLFPGQPGAVLAVRSPLLDERPELGATLIRLIDRATEFIREYPEEAADIIAASIGDGLIDPAILERAIAQSRDSFVADPGLSWNPPPGCRNSSWKPAPSPRL
jgi:NitT/TauT family transport system substrate-binding protein